MSNNLAVDYSLCHDTDEHEDELDLDKSLQEQGINEDGVSL